MVAGVAAFALIRLGIVPDASELLRIVLWLLVTFVYVSLLAGLRHAPVGRRPPGGDVGAGRVRDVAAAVVLRRADRRRSSAASSPRSRGTAEEQLANIGIQETLSRLLPDTLYREASLTLLNPQVTTVSTPATIGGYEQAQQRIPSLLSLDQSFILVWPQVVGLVALTVACFALAYVHVHAPGGPRLGVDAHRWHQRQRAPRPAPARPRRPRSTTRRRPSARSSSRGRRPGAPARRAATGSATRPRPDRRIGTSRRPRPARIVRSSSACHSRFSRRDVAWTAGRRAASAQASSQSWNAQSLSAGV